MYGGRRLVVGVLFGLLWLGCDTSQHVRLATAIDAGRSNELAATADFRGQVLRTQGIVTQVGIKRVERESGTSTPGVWGTREITINRYTVAHPYLYAQDAQHPGGGQLLCFFDPDELKHVARITEGMHVAVEGLFQQFSDRGSTLVLNHCELD